MFQISIALLMMAAVIIASNILVFFPINDWLTWGAFTYPISFMITELTVRAHGSSKARSVVYAGFAVGVVISVGLSTPRIALASGFAFLISQLLDIAVFSRLRQNTTWWLAPLCASGLASIIDSGIFWTVAFLGEDLPFISWAIGDTAVKFAVDLAMLLPFKLITFRLSSPAGAAGFPSSTVGTSL